VGSIYRPNIIFLEFPENLVPILAVEGSFGAASLGLMHLPTTQTEN
jgi:hypothetical protein